MNEKLILKNSFDGGIFFKWVENPLELLGWLVYFRVLDRTPELSSQNLWNGVQNSASFMVFKGIFIRANTWKSLI